MNLAPTIVIATPIAVDEATAAALLGVSVPQLHRLVRAHPDRLRVFNMIGGGHRSYSTETLREFIAWRESVGWEAKAG